MPKDEMRAEPAGSREKEVFLFSSPGVARLLLALTSCYILLASVFIYFVDVPDKLRLFNLYYLLMVGIAAFLAASSLREVKFQWRSVREDWRWLRILVIFGAGAVAWVAYRYPQLFSFSLWLDEATQFYGDWHLPRKNIIDPALFAATQQQPPIDYYLSAFARNVFGFTELSARFHAVAFGVLGYVAFLIWLVRVRFPLMLAPIPILLFAAHHSLLRFSAEARPISLAVFFALITLLFVHESVHEKRVCVRALGASALLLLYSVGLQPIFFITILGISLLPLLFKHFAKAEAAKLLLALCIVPLVLFSPTLWEIYRESERGHQFYASSYLGLWWGALRALSWERFSIYRQTFQFAQWVFFIPAVVLALAMLLKKLNFKSVPFATRSWAISGIIFLLLFPVSFQIFWSAVNWFKQPHYFILWTIGSLALASLCIAYLSRSILAGRGRVLIGFFLLLLGGYGTYALQPTYVAAHRSMVDGIFSLRPDWHTIMEEARSSPRPVKIMEVPYAELGALHHHFVAGSFYEDPPKSRIIALEDPTKKWGFATVNIGGNVDFDKSGHPSDLFYLLIPDDDGQSETQKNKILPTLTANADKVLPLSERFFLVRVNNQDSASAVTKTKQLFESIIAADPGSDKIFYLADALVRESIRKNECGTANKWLDIMKSIHVEASHPLYPRVKTYLSEMGARIDNISSCSGERIGRRD